MAENKSTQSETKAATSGGLNLKPKAEKAPEIQPPTEYKSINGGITIVKEGDEITINFNELIAQEIGSYRKSTVGVKFKEGGHLQFIIKPI